MDQRKMIRLGEPLPLRHYLRNLWSLRTYMIQVPIGEFRSKHLNTVLGNLWHLLNPGLQIAVYYLVFGLILQTDRGMDNFITFLTLGVMPFRWWSSAVQSGASAISANIGTIRAVQFPRAMLPISSFVESLLSFLPTIPIILFVAIATGEPVSWRWITIVFTLIGLGGSALGLTFFVARLTTKISDLSQVLPIVFRLMFYTSGILYSVDKWIPNETVRTLLALNPVYSGVTLMRWAVLDSAARSEHIISLVLWPLLAVPAGFVFFRRGEANYG